MLPSEIPKLPTDPLVRGFPGVWKILLFLQECDHVTDYALITLGIMH